MLNALCLGALLCVSAAVSAETTRPSLTGIDHVVFKSSDLAAARRFYGDLLGLASPQAAAASQALASQPAPLLFRMNARQHLFVVPGLAPDSDERLDHVAFATADLAGFAAYLREKGVKVDGPTRQSSCGKDALRVVDPDGHVIEFVQETAIRSAATGSAALSPRLLHAGVTVHNEVAANAFYHDVLGMTEIWRGGFDPAKTNWVNVRLPESADYLEYMLRDAPSTRRQLGVDHHVCLVVPDIQVAWELVRERTPDAAQAALQPPQIGRNGKWQINLYDPDGTRIELMEPYNVR